MDDGYRRITITITAEQKRRLWRLANTAVPVTHPTGKHGLASVLLDMAMDAWEEEQNDRKPD